MEISGSPGGGVHVSKGGVHVSKGGVHVSQRGVRVLAPIFLL